MQRVLCLAALVVVAVSAVENVDGLTPDMYPLDQHMVNLTTKSGPIFFNTAVANASKSGKTYLLWDTTITPAKGAINTQLYFDRSTFLSNFNVDEVTLKIWSEQDGAVQMLNAHTIRQWDFKTAIFNGDSVRVQVLAIHGAGLVDVKIIGALVGEQDADTGYGALCGNTDQRVRSTTRENFRYTTSGSCSGGIISVNGGDGGMMSAGHCGSGTAGSVAFNVPLSSSSGQTRQPGPEDQYSIDSQSVQYSNGGVGNDWKHICAFPNSNTGRTAFSTQGASFPFVFNPSGPPAGNFIHNGHGSTSPRNTLNLVNKGERGGGTWTRATNTLRYRFDTTGGDSGSAVADSRGNYVGIHTHGGCRPGSSSSSNAGTWFGRSQTQTAVQNPRGVCSNEGRAKAMQQRYGVHFLGDVHAFEGPTVNFGN